MQHIRLPTGELSASIDWAQRVMSIPLRIDGGDAPWHTQIDVQRLVMAVSLIPLHGDPDVLDRLQLRVRVSVKVILQEPVTYYRREGRWGDVVPFLPHTALLHPGEILEVSWQWMPQRPAVFEPFLLTVNLHGLEKSVR